MKLVLCSVTLAVVQGFNSIIPQRHLRHQTRLFSTEAPAVDEAELDDVAAELDELMGAPEALLADMEDLSEEALIAESADFGPPKPYVNFMAIQEATEKWRRDEKDVGSSEVQIARAHARIKYLTEHLQRNPKDYASRRGLVAIVNKRRRLLNYLFRQNPTKALTMVKELGIRFKPPGAVQSRAEKYAVYNSKSRKKRK